MRIVVLLMFFCVAAGLVLFTAIHNGYFRHFTFHHLQFKPYPLQESAMKTRAKIKQGDFASVDKGLEQIFTQSNQKKRDDYPFVSFLGWLVPASDAEFGSYLDAWVKAEPKSAMAYLVRAKYEIDRGWFIRGHGYMNTVRPTAAGRFGQLQEQAYHDVVQYIAIRDDNPYAYDLLMVVTLNIGDNDLQNQVFNRAVARFPDYRGYYYDRLHQLEPKWGGSIPQMVAFVSTVTANAAKTSWRNQLWLNLYDAMAINVGQSCRGTISEDIAKCATLYQQMMDDNVPESKLDDALQAYKKIDLYSFNDFLLSTPAPKIVEIARHILPTDNYALNFALGMVNYPIQSSSCDDCLSVTRLRRDAVTDPNAAYDYFRKSFDEARASAFANEGQKNTVLAKIASALSKTASTLGDDVAARQYLDYALSLDDRSSELYTKRCDLYFHAQNYYKAIDDCTAALDLDDSNVFALFLRAMSLFDMNNVATAKSDFKAVIERQEQAGPLMVAVAYDYLNEYRQSLDVINLYPTIFDSDDPDDLANAYDARCLDYDMLGEYKKALDDCNKSLSFEYSYTAASKRHDLMQKLGMSN